MENQSSDDSGLVISSKSGEDLFDGFVSEEALNRSIETFGESPSYVKGDNRNTHRIELSPGTVRLSRTSPIRKAKSPNFKARTKIKEWSRKSRASMTFRYGTLDYRPLFKDGRLPALVTLTYPGKWDVVAPTSADAQRHLRTFKKRYEYHFGKPLIALWKREHQRSGSPHFHLFMAVPVGQSFKSWLSITWADIVAHPDPLERVKHELAGTAVDYPSGFQGVDPARIAVYFSKHNSADFGKKEYQNKPPREWIDAGSIGRFWGYWGLKPLVVSKEISIEDALFISRTLRRWTRANSERRRKLVPRVNQRTGVVKLRGTHRRKGRFQTGRGFAVVSDGSAMGEALSRALRARGQRGRVV